MAITDLREVTSPKDAEALLAESPSRGLIPRGRGRAYGDAAQNSGGITATIARVDAGRVSVDTAGLVTAPAGATIEDILRAIIPNGWFVPVTPGTARASLGGCLAADVHGKNHHCDGAFSAHTREITLTTPSAGTVTCTAEDDSFVATAGGMGLTGIIESAAFQAIPIESAQMRVRRTRTSDLHHTMDELRAADARTRYSVAWLDLLARGRSLGRGVVIEGDHAALVETSRDTRSKALSYSPSVRAAVPVRLPVNALSRLGVAMFNRAYYAANRAGSEHLESITQFFHPLDAIRDWNHLYGTRGFLQYQFVVPDTHDGSRALVSAIQTINRSGHPGFLTVLKRFGPEGSGLLSFPCPGWTLTVDLPCGGNGLRALLMNLDDIVLQAGGRIYMAKDAVASPEMISAMYPRLAEWQAVQRRLDPHGVMQSDLSRRLALTASSNTRGRG